MNNNTISLATSAVNSMATTTVLSGDFLGNDYSKIGANLPRDRLTEGLNNITKSILQQRGVSGQFEKHDDIPLRPLLINGNQGNSVNKSQGSEIASTE